MKPYLPLLFLLLSLVGNAQTFEEYAQQRNAEFNKFVSERDKEFADFLRKRWEEFETFKGIEAKPMPKPVVTPIYTPEPEPPAPTPMPFIEPKIEPIIPTPLPVIKPVKVILPKAHLSYIFYDCLVEIPVSKTYNLPNYNPLKKNEAIASFWEQMAGSKYDEILYGLLEHKKKYQLNDWGFYLLLREAMKAISSNNNTEQLSTWFFLKKAGYAAKIGYSENGNISLMIPMNQLIYDTSYCTFNGVKYYYTAEKNKNSSIYTYEDSDDGKTFDLNIPSPLNFDSEESFVRELTFTYNGNDYKVAVEACKSAVAFYNDYPHTSFDVYFNASPSPRFIKSISEQLKSKLIEMDFKEQCNFLISLTQKGFEYKTDQEQFGIQQRSFFPEETLFYPYSDCEDRAIFYSYLVSTIVKSKIVGVLYNGHMATAIKDSEGVFSGSYFDLKDGRFVVADPTYTNAKVGRCMPQYCGKDAEIIKVKR